PYEEDQSRANRKRGDSTFGVYWTTNVGCPLFQPVRACHRTCCLWAGAEQRAASSSIKSRHQRIPGSTGTRCPKWLNPAASMPKQSHRLPTAEHGAISPCCGRSAVGQSSAVTRHCKDVQSHRSDTRANSASARSFRREL